MRKMLEYQADRIEAVLQQHRVPGRVTGGVVTPRFIRFEVAPALDTRISAIRGLSEELAAALDAPACRVARQGATVVVEVPREKPGVVGFLPLLRGLRAVPPVTAVLGLADDGAPLLIRLPSPDVAHILVAGTTGSGKTALLRTMALSLALRHPCESVAGFRVSGFRSQPETCNLKPETRPLILLLIDPKGRAFSDLAGLPQLARPVIVDVAEALEALGSLVRLMERRDLAGVSDPPVVVFIDELADLMMVGGAAAQQRLTRLVQRGREAGIHLVAATQKPTAAVLGPLVRANFPVRIVGKVVSAEDARAAAGIGGTGAERLEGHGDFIAVAEGRVHRFQAAYITPEETRRLVEALRARWAGEEPAPSEVEGETEWEAGPPPRLGAGMEQALEEVVR
jgi:S-DNA-T family DNA segregation ATPase FtsK/SpoIIIE